MEGFHSLNYDPCIRVKRSRILRNKTFRNRCLPASETMTTETPFDPFQVFEVYHKHCAIIYVKIVRGRRITKGWAKDLREDDVEE
ncbi:hypothetical protein Btru_076461 [Bulinus truncatus]|nr:hypothetical protein Btru_076461 [Bulinus truncatus]